MFARLLPILCLSVSPVLAQDACPSGSDALKSGVTVSFDGMQVDYRSQPDGRILETERHEGEGEIWVYLSDPSGLVHDSHMLGPDGTPDESTREIYRYVFSGGIPVAEPDSNWTGRETSLIGGVAEEALVSWSFSKVVEYRIGGCRFSVLWVHETRSSVGANPSEAPWINQYVHIIDLGFSIYLGGDEVGVDPVLEVPLSISARPL